MFKVGNLSYKHGDKVICIDARASDLIYGDVYTVERSYKHIVVIIGDKTNWRIRRFVPDTTASKILYLKEVTNV